MIGQSVGSDASPLSCFLFRPRKSREKRRKCSHTNVSNTLVARPSTPPAQTPQRSFQQAAAGTHATPAPNRAHNGLHGETGAFRTGGGITTLGAFCAVRKPCAAGYQNGKLCRFLALVRCVLEERREPAGQRCAHARRCSEASRPRWAAWSRCCSSHRIDWLHNFAQPHRCAQKVERLFFSSASATERTRDLCGLFPWHIAKYAANRCIYSTNLSIPFCAAPL